MKIDLFLLIVAALMILAMILTIVYGKRFSRHGYGLTTSFEHHLIV